MSIKLNYRSDIDGLRAIAIISVLFFHLGYQQVSGGFVGVDVFFVISGFLITGIIKKEIEATGTFSIKNFYIRRVRRLFPVLFVTLFLTITFAILVFSPTHLSRIGGALTSSILNISNIYFWLEADYFDVSAKLKPLLHTWSLSVEEQFYFIWPLPLLGLMKFKKSWLPPLFLVLTVVLSLYLNVEFSDGRAGIINKYAPQAAEWIKDARATIFFLLPFRIFEFAIGAIVVWLIHYKSKQWIYDILFLVGFGLIAYSIFSFTDKMLFPSFYGLAPSLGASLLLYSGNHSRLNIVLTNPVAVGIGLISYSLYLIHSPIIVFWEYLTELISIKDSLIILIISLLLAILSYKYIEQPFRQKQYDLVRPKWKYSSIIAVILLAYAGINMKQNDGWTWRISSPVVFDNAIDAKDFHKKMYGGVGYNGFYPRTSRQADIVLIGDSHGRHYAEGLNQVIKDTNLSLYVSACYSSIYLPGFIRTSSIALIKGSKIALQKDLAYIKNGNTPVVIISESWLSQMTLADIVDSQGNRKNKKITIDDIINGIYELKKLIGESQLIVVGNVPGARHNLYDVFSRPRPLIFSSFNPDKYLTTIPYPARIKFNKKLHFAAKSSGKFIFLDPHDILCTDSVCNNLDSQKHLIYSDISHLSKYGSIEVINGFKSIILKALESRK
ncbi:O-antigen acetylase [hydrothermal vent metagenome]|uniref:O-antigen acetylase n=1 Tax=hydrothermal vent metagenome TaxID=652676 RepID=A0A3B0YKV0_9ZZZZ